MISIDLVLIISAGLVIFFSALAAYFDYKTTYIFDWITYPMIIIGVILLPFRADWYIGLVSAVIVYLFFIPFYKYGKIGGGDIKYFLGICLLLPTYGEVFFILPVFFFASVLAGFFFGVRFISQFFYKKIYLGIEKKELIFKVILSLFFGIFCAIFLSFVYNLYLSFVAGLLFSICLFVLFFQKKFYLEFSYKIKLEEITEDDIVDLSCINKNGTQLIDEKLKQTLTDKGIKELIVYRNLPVFAPFLFLGVIISLFVFIP